jgi:hypothetical protein
MLLLLLLLLLCTLLQLHGALTRMVWWPCCQP